MSLYLNTELVTGYPIVPPVWDDLRVPLNAIRVGAAAPPGFDVFKQNAGLLEIDFHLEFDSAGSRTEYAK